MKPDLSPRFVSIVASLSIWVLVVHGVRGAERVLDWGDWNRLEFSGNKTFTAQKIREGLVGDADFLLAAHPLASLPDYLETVKARVELGYRSLGFREPAVEVKLDEAASKVRVKITEGPRYRNGAVRITGATNIPVAKVIVQLTETNFPAGTISVPSSKIPPNPGSSPASFNLNLNLNSDPAQGASQQSYLDSNGKPVSPASPLWPTNEPASFHPGAGRVAHEAITNALADAGFYFSKFSFAVVPDAVTGKADLRIDIREEGPRLVLAEVNFTGNRRNSRATLMKFLGLGIGMPVSAELVSQVERRLWHSGRFTHYRVGINTAKVEARKADLEVFLREFEDVPPLDQALEAGDVALVKFGDWCTTFRNRDEDLVGTASFPETALATAFAAELVVSPRDGLVFRVYPSAKSASRPKFAAAYGRHGMFLYRDSLASRLNIPGIGKKFSATILMVPTPAEEYSETNRFSVTVGGGFHTGDSKTNAARFELGVLAAPVATLGGKHLELSRAIENGIFSLMGKQSALRIDAATGRFVEYRSSTFPTLTGEITNADVRVSVSRDAARRAVAELESGSATVPNAYKGEHPMASTLGYVADLLLRDDMVAKVPLLNALFSTNATAQQYAAAAPVVRRFIESSALAPLDAALFSLGDDDGEDFNVVNAAVQGGANPIVAILGTAFRYMNVVFPRRSWPWTLAHEAVFIANGKSRYIDAELTRLYESDDVGPIGYLAAAKIFNAVNIPAARPFAQRGMTSLSKEDFRKDCRLLLRDPSMLQKTVLASVAELAKIPAQDIEAVAAILQPEWGDALRKAAENLRADPKQSPEASAQAALDQLWEGSLRRTIRTQLVQVLNPPSPKPPKK